MSRPVVRTQSGRRAGRGLAPQRVRRTRRARRSCVRSRRRRRWIPAGSSGSRPTRPRSLRGSPPSPSCRVGLVLDHPEPRRGAPVGLAVAGADCRVVGAGPEFAPRFLDAIVRSGRPIVGHETKQILVAHIDAVDPRAERSASEIPLPQVAFDTQVAAYILNATLRSQPLVDIAFERLGVQLPARSDLQPWHAAALEALAVAAVRGPLRDALAAESLDRLYGEIELPLIPVLAGLEATGVKIDREALAALSALFGEEIGRLEAEIYARRRPRVQPWQPQTARAGALPRAEPAHGQAHQDGILHRRDDPRGTAGRPIP